MANQSKVEPVPSHPIQLDCLALISNEIDYKIDSKIRWGVLYNKLIELDLDTRRQLIKDATNYQSGPGLMNTVYMGSMATAGLYTIFNKKYCEGGLHDGINAADSDTVNEGIKYSMHTIEFMLHFPVKKCPTCGNIVPAGHKS